MQLTEFIRKSFTVEAVEVTFENYEQVAEWCKGTVDLQSTKMMGTETKLPVIKLAGTGELRGKEVTATLGCYVVKFKESFRVYKSTSFFTAFEKKVTLEDLEKNVTPQTMREWAEDGATSLGKMHFVDIRSEETA